MKIRPSLSTAIAIVFGLIVLLGYFVEIPSLSKLQQYFLQSTIPVAAIALLVGITNLGIVHWRKASTGGKGSLYSALLIFSLLVTLVIAGYFGPTGDWSLWIFNYIQVPVEGSLMAILTVALALAGVRLLRRRLDVFSLIFLGTGALVLLGTVPLFGIELPGIYGPSSFRSLITQIPAVAGARGILLGVALGSIATGLRVLVGADRPYRG
jgi:hypothetical protein